MTQKWSRICLNKENVFWECHGISRLVDLLFLFGKVTCLDVLDMFNLKKLHFCSYVFIFANILSEKPIFAAGTGLIQ